MTGSASPQLPKIDQRIRFVIEYEGAWRPLGWIRAGKDGSIYVGSLIGRPDIRKGGRKACAEANYDYVQGAPGSHYPSQEFAPLLSPVW